MQITLFSNFLNHHQVPLCNEMVRHIGANFTFVSTEPVPDERLAMGYKDYRSCSYNLAAYWDQSSWQKALKLGIDSDIVISGSAPRVFIEERIRQNKHTFFYSERLLKKGDWQLLNPRVWMTLYRNHAKFRSKKVYMLCASAYTANDLVRVRAYPDKKYKWGYFPEMQELDIERVLSSRPTDRLNLIWVGRILGWKHPEMAVKSAYELKKKGNAFHLKMIGVGELTAEIRSMVRRLGVSDCVSILGGISNSEVLEQMRNSNIFLFTSDRGEGWGAVLNEAMGCGCAVVASHEIGAVPYLIDHGRNGLVFKSRSTRSLLQNLELLFHDKKMREMLGRNAYQTIKEEWSPQRAAANIIQLAESLVKGSIHTIESGPCSKAEPIRTHYWEI